MAQEMLLKKIATVEPKGHLSAANTKELEEQLASSVTNGECSIILVDMSRVDFIDSASLMVLATSFRKAQSMGRRFSICSVSPSVAIIFELTQLDKVFEIFENRRAFELTLT